MILILEYYYSHWILVLHCVDCSACRLYVAVVLVHCYLCLVSSGVGSLFRQQRPPVCPPHLHPETSHHHHYDQVIGLDVAAHWLALASPPNHVQLSPPETLNKARSRSFDL